MSADVRSSGSWPASTWRRRAASSAERVIGPTWSMVVASGDDAAERDAPVRRHEAGHPRPVGRAADRPAGVAPERARSEPAGQHRRRAHAGAAGEARRVPGVSGRAVLIRVQRPVRELRRVRLPEDDRSGRPESRDDARVLLGHEVRQHLGSAGGPLASRPAEVLHGHRHAVEGTASLARGELPLGDARLGEDPLGVERDEGVQRGLEALAATQERLAELDGRERSSREAEAELRDPGVSELDVAQRSVPQSRPPARRVAPRDQEAPREELGARRRGSTPVGLATLVRRPLALPAAPALAQPAVDDDLHTGRLAESPAEVLVELRLVAADDDENARRSGHVTRSAGGLPSPPRP